VSDDIEVVKEFAERRNEITYDIEVIVVHLLWQEEKTWTTTCITKNL
jgi:hypothetical protein